MNAHDHDVSENSDNHDDGNDTALSEDLRKALQSAVIGICEMEEENEENASSSGIAVSGSAINAITELTFLYATTSLARDLDAFATHAGRQTITDADVKLVARKNPDILEKLELYCQQYNVSKKPKARRKKDATDSKMKGGKNEQSVSGNADSFPSDNSNNIDGSSSEAESDLEEEINRSASERKRPRPPDKTAAEPPAMSSDSSSSDDDFIIGAASKKNVATNETFELNDSSSSSSSSEDEKEAQARKRTSASDMLKVLEASASHLSDSEDD